MSIAVLHYIYGMGMYMYMSALTRRDLSDKNIYKKMNHTLTHIHADLRSISLLDKHEKSWILNILHFRGGRKPNIILCRLPRLTASETRSPQIYFE
jgi:hypothetical protein